MMACACSKRNRSKQRFVWTDGENTVVYKTEIEAKAKVSRKGGTYEVKKV